MRREGRRGGGREEGEEGGKKGRGKGVEGNIRRFSKAAFCSGAF